MHRTLKGRAATAGMSLSEYLGQEVARLAPKPTWEEMAERLRQRGPIRTKLSAAALIRRDRGKRDC